MTAFCTPGIWWCRGYGISTHNDQVAAGAMMWVVGSVTLLISAVADSPQANSLGGSQFHSPKKKIED